MMLVFPRPFYDLFRPVLDAYLKKRWNSRWHRTTVLCRFRGLGYVDVRDILNGDTKEEIEQYLKPIAQSITTTKYNDDKVIDILRWVHSWVRYKGDFDVWKKAEYWQNATQTLLMRTGDCEDGAILIYKLAILAGVPEWRIKVCAGYVQSPTNPAKKVGHAYTIYLSEQYNEWFVLDWCYWYRESMSAYLKIPHRKMSKYREIWWTTNHLYSWAQHDTVVF